MSTALSRSLAPVTCRRIGEAVPLDLSMFDNLLSESGRAATLSNVSEHTWVACSD